MSEPTSFLALMQRVRSGEAKAAEELLRQYEPTVRRAIRVRMVNPSLRRTVDSMDLCQSVMGSFFVRTALGQYELSSPEQLIGLLVKLARNKVADHVRREHAQLRDRRRTDADGAALDFVAGRQESPSQIVAGAEILDQFRVRLSAEERYLAEQRAQGREWNELAAELRQNAEALRKQLQRAVDRVAEELGMEL
ncbi:MAG: RNA polymerase subunit sigma-24 [Gemmataceae bacterium]|nr:RNA polymerase subunit sigma-24 [Gemmataceae bacterium]